MKMFESKPVMMMNIYSVLNQTNQRNKNDGDGQTNYNMVNK